LKKIAAISFLFIFICATTEVGQLLKLPVLIHHYLEHHLDDEGISFIGFLHKHYGEEISHSSPNNEHKELPFKTHPSIFAQVNLVFHVPVGYESKIDKPISKDKIIIYPETFQCSFAISKIWQPPRIS
jgi:hypothetical protein